MNSAITFIAGDDTGLVALNGQKQFDHLSAGLDSFGCEIFSGQLQVASEVGPLLDRVIEALFTPSMFGGKKAVWLKSVNFLSDTPLGRAEATQEALQKFFTKLEKLPADSPPLLITAFPVDRRRKEYKSLEKISIAQYHQAFKNSADLVTYLESYLQAEAPKVQLKGGALRLLAEQVHGNTQMAISEINKLLTFLNFEGQLTEAIVAEQVPVFGEGDFFYPVEAFFTEPVAKVLQVFEDYFYTHKELRSLLSMLENRTRLLMQLRALADAKILPFNHGRLDANSFSELAQEYAFGSEKSSYNLFSQNAWYLGRLVPLIAKWPLRKLVDLQLFLQEAFEDTISSPKEGAFLVRKICYRFLS